MKKRNKIPFFGNNIMPLLFGFAVVLFASHCNNNRVEDKNNEHKAEQVNMDISVDLPWSQRMTESIIKRNPESWMTDFRETPRWSYTHGLVLMAIQKVYEDTGDERYFNYVKSYADTMITVEGEIKNYNIDEYNIDHINPGKILFGLHDQTKDDRYEKVMFTLRKQLEWQPRTTDDGFWHKLRYTYQMWLDGLYMGAPYYAQFAERYNQPEAFDDIAHQLILMESRSRDEATGLLYHGWDESRVQSWANTETGKSPEFWGRAMGWYAMALVDVLDYFPEDHAKRGEIIDILNRLAEAVTKVQDESTGLWYQVLDKGGQQGNYLEATASSMFSYALIKGVNNGYLPDEYRQVAQKAYNGILENLIEVEPSGEIHIHKCCAVAGLGGNPYRGR